MVKKIVKKKKVVKKKGKKEEKIKSSKGKKLKRKRLSREETKARINQTNSGGDWLNLPDGIERWIPEKKGRYMIDILPYEISVNNHPDNIETSLLWYRTQFTVHHGVGAKEQSVICPRSIGKKCPICDEVDRLRKDDKDANEEIIKQLRGQKFSAMNIKHPDDPDAIAVLVLSYGKFDKVLKDELDEDENEEHLGFYHCDDEGRSLKVRFSEESFLGNKYLQATKIEFKERDEMNEDEILEKVVDLDTILNVLPYEKIAAMFLEGEEKEEEEEEKKPKPKKKKAFKKVDKDEEEDEDEDEEEFDFDEGEEEDEEEEDEDEIPEGKKECIACEGTGKSSKGKKCKPCKGTGLLDDDDEEEDEEDEDEDGPFETDEDEEDEDEEEEDEFDFDDEEDEDEEDEDEED